MSLAVERHGAGAQPGDVVERADVAPDRSRGRDGIRLGLGRGRRLVHRRHSTTARARNSCASPSGGTFRPGIGLRVALACQEAVAQRGPVRRVLDDARADERDADPFHPGRGALQVARLLAIELQEGGAVLQHLVLGRRPCTSRSVPRSLDAAVAADVQVLAGLDADHADVLDRGLGAVARAAGDGELRSCAASRSPRSCCSSLMPMAGGILRAEAAPFRCRRRSSPCAAPCRRRGRRPCRRAFRSRPDRAAGRSFLTPSRSMRWPPVTFTVGMSILVDHVGDGAQFGRRGHAAPHARHHRIGAVLLDVGVHALVDEAATARRRGIRPARRRAGSS